MKKLRIVHCFRSPVGGILRHVRDLIDAQIAAGHQIGILCDSITGGAFEEALIAELAPRLTLGVHRVTMRRAIGPTDIVDLCRTYALIRDIAPDVLHGHGAKGGAYARLVGTAIRLSGTRTARLYTPHGGSMHYDPRTIGGRLFFALERIFERMTDHLLFVSEYEKTAYRTKVGEPRVPARIVYNGLSEAEFSPEPVDANAVDFLYIGMLRALKGPDIFIEALGEIARSTGIAPTAVVVGAGEQKGELVRRAEALLPGQVKFYDPMPIRRALRLARIMVLPSRADSLPYVLLEAISADRPVVAVDVGGVSEIIPPDLQPLARPNDAAALAAMMAARLAQPLLTPHPLMQHVRSRFALARMASDTMAAYREAIRHSRKANSSRQPLEVSRLEKPAEPVRPANAKES
ncbi:transferase [Aureimonas sp. SA4125]|uniref:glycosyltransferase n=1 Tax=Aureimonas sp. SA4125 TaxID=2826993 RepID=UPI001CC6578F|nr:glycosyltransferase [Aureimonas sp. SA4125]BDA84084.1 transferase [Aureimonas sp. SA4125]